MNVVGGKLVSAKEGGGIVAELATAQLWGSAVQFLPLLGAAGASAPSLLAAGCAAVKLLECTTDAAAASQAIDDSGGSGSGHFVPYFGSKCEDCPDGDCGTKIETLRTYEVDHPPEGENVYYVGDPDADDGALEPQVVSTKVEEKPESLQEYGKMMKDIQAKASTVSTTNFSEKELKAQGFVRQEDGRWTRTFERPAETVRIDATETTTMVKRGPAKTFVTEATVMVPEVNWVPKVLKFWHTKPASFEVETQKTPTTVARDVTAVGVQEVRPQAPPEKTVRRHYRSSRRHHCHPHGQVLATMAAPLVVGCGHSGVCGNGCCHHRGGGSYNSQLPNSDASSMMEETTTRGGNHRTVRA